VAISIVRHVALLRHAKSILSVLKKNTKQVIKAASLRQTGNDDFGLGNASWSSHQSPPLKRQPQKK
jgi:hypothetical protein